METPQKGPSGLYEQTILGKTYSFTEWPIRIWLDRYAMLMGVAGEFLARLLTAANAGESVSEDLIARLAETLMRNIGKDRQTSLQLIEALCSELVFVDGKKMVFAVEFNHQPMRLHLVCAAAVAVQFGPLFAEARALFDQGESNTTSTPKNSAEGSGQS